MNFIIGKSYSLTHVQHMNNDNLVITGKFIGYDYEHDGEVKLASFDDTDGCTDFIDMDFIKDWIITEL